MWLSVRMRGHLRTTKRPESSRLGQLDERGAIQMSSSTNCASQTGAQTSRTGLKLSQGCSVSCPIQTSHTVQCIAMLHLYPNSKWSWDFRYRNLSQLDGLPSSNTSHFTNTTSKGENKYKYKDLTKAPNVVKMFNNKWSRSYPLQRFRVAARICLLHDKKFHRTDESLMESNAFKHQFKRECRNIIYQSNRMLFCLSSHELSLLMMLSFSLS